MKKLKNLFKKSFLYKIYWMKSVNRFNLNFNLVPIFLRLPKFNRILDIGSQNAPYKKYLRYKRYFTLDIDKGSSPDILGDICTLKWREEDFDLILMTEVLEHLESPEKAIKKCYRLLKKRGLILVTTRFIHPYHPCPKDFYRFTEDSLKSLFKDFSRIEIFPQGNRLLALWFFLTENKFAFLLKLLNPLIARINFKDKRFPLGFIVLAKK